MTLSSQFETLSGGFLILACAVLLAGCGGGGSSSGSQFSQTDVRAGTGAEAVNGRTLTVNYTGWLHDPAQPEQKGQQFDSSVGSRPFNFVLGAGQVIPGWDRGVAGMKVGGLRRLVIPADLAYGATGAGNGAIPPNATLVFDVELLDVKS